MEVFSNMKKKSLKMSMENLDYENMSNISGENLADSCEESMKIFGTNKNVYRAIKSMIDGLKPVHRRILYSMYKSKARTQNVKMAAVTASTLAYHPHGDVAIADVAGNLAQEFSNNVVLLDAQGNPGTIKGDQAAAARYLEVKLSKYSLKCFFEDFETSNVDMKMAYTGQDEEPEFLPARYPHALINPQFGAIGYGAASNIPPYNFTEVLNATMDLMKNPNKNIYLVPDSPTGADIIDDGQFATICEKGTGTLTLRGSVEIDSEKNRITITSLPLQCTVRQFLTKVVELKKSKELDDIIDIKDYTNSKIGVKTIIYLKPNVNANKVLDILYKKTVLQKTYPVGINLIDDYKLYDYGVKSFLLAWISYRRDIIRSSYNTQLVKNKEKEYMNDIILFVLNKDNAEKTLEICKKSSSKAEAISKLMKRYKITSLQASTIANMRMYEFTQDAYEGFKQKKIELAAEIAKIEEILMNDKLIDKVIEDQLKEGIKLFGHPRKSRIIPADDIVADTQHVIAISYDGYCKKLPSDVGIIGKVGSRNDYNVFTVSNKDRIILFSDGGKCSAINVSDIPDCDGDGDGIPINRYTKLTGNVVASILIPRVDSDDLDNYTVLLTTKNSFMKRTHITEFINSKSTKTAISLTTGDTLVSVISVFQDTTKECIVYSNKGNGVRFKFDQFKIMGANTRGLQQLQLSDDEEIIGVDAVSTKKKLIFMLTSNGKYKLVELSMFPTMKRKAELLNLANTSSKENIVGLKTVNKRDIITVYHKTQASETVNISDLDISTRVSKCKKLIKTPSGDSVIGFRIN
jgi:DNA gyrase subunit A